MDDFTSDTVNTNPTYSPESSFASGRLVSVNHPIGPPPVDVTASGLHATPAESASGLTSFSAQLPGRVADITISKTPILLSSPLPAAAAISTRSTPSGSRTRKRGRPPLTSENSPSVEDSRILISLGMSPFMPGQDGIYNQNRSVKNEAILSRHLASLQRSFSQLESNQERLSEEVHRTLSDHQRRIDQLSIAPAGTRNEQQIPAVSNHDLLALRRGHAELLQAVDAILRYLTLPTTSSDTGLDELIATARSLSSNDLGGVGLPPHSPRVVSTGLRRKDYSRRKPAVSALEEQVGRGIRARQNPYPNSLGRQLQITRPLIPLYAQHLSRPDDPDVVDSSDSNGGRRVLYGPIDNADDPKGSMTLIEEALRNVGMTMSMLRSVRRIPGRVGHLSLEFLQEADASRFLEFRELGLSHVQSSEPPLPSATGSGIRPWQL